MTARRHPLYRFVQCAASLGLFFYALGYGLPILPLAAVFVAGSSFTAAIIGARADTQRELIRVLTQDAVVTDAMTQVIIEHDLSAEVETRIREQRAHLDELDSWSGHDPLAAQILRSDGEGDDE